MKKMKKIVLIAIGIFLVGCSNRLDKNNVEKFVIEHFEVQTDSVGAVKAMDENISDSIILFNLSNGWVGRPDWVNDVSKIKSEWFYEDSIKTEITDIEIIGNIASVYGNATWFVSGVKTSRAGFHSVIAKENGKLVFIRHSWMNWDINRSANSFVWPSTKVEGALDLYNEMRFAMANLRNNDALAYSDSLVKIDPNLAVAHVGKMHYLYMKGKSSELNELIKEIEPKLKNASLAEKYYIKTLSPSSSREEVLEKYETALIYAANDPLLRGWYAYFLEDLDERIENINIGLRRLPENIVLNNMMGYLMLEKGNFEAAKNHININMTIHPDEPNVYDSMGDILLASGDTLKAKEMFLTAYELSRNLKTGAEEFFNVSKEKAEALN
tara:strand:+ start:12 stop:1160 length:1149 start_codon:yes stop_codon:yes gene_type:complete